MGGTGDTTPYWSVNAAEVEAKPDGARDELRRVLDALASGLPALAEALTDVYLRHVFMARLPVDTRERRP